VTLSLVQTAQSNASGTTNVKAFASNVTVNNLIIITSYWPTGLGTPVITDTLGNTYSIVHGPVTDGNVGIDFATFACFNNKSTGANTVTATWTSTLSFGIMQIHEFTSSAAHTSGWAFDVGAFATGGIGVSATSGTSGNTATTTNANEIVFGWCLASGGNATPPTGYTTANLFSGSGSLTAYKIVTATGVQAANFTFPSGTWDVWCMTFYVVAGVVNNQTVSITSTGAVSISKAVAKIVPIASIAAVSAVKAIGKSASISSTGAVSAVKSALKTILLVSSSSAGGIAFNASADGGDNNGTTTSLTFSYTVGGGTNRLLVVQVQGDTAVDDVTGVTYGGLAMTLAAKETTAFADNRISYLFFLLNPPSGAHNVVISASTSHFLLGGAADYTGVAQSGQPDATATHIGANSLLTSLTTSITTVANNAWAVLVESGFAVAGSDPPGAGTGDVLRVSNTPKFSDWGIFDSGGPVTPAGSYGMTTTRISPGSQSISHVIASFAPASGVTVAKQTGKGVAIASVAALAVVKAIAHGVSLGSVGALTMTRATAKNVAIVSSGALAIVKRVGKTLAINSSATVSVLVGRAFTVAIAISSSASIGVVKSVGKSVAILSSASVGISKNVGKRVGVASSGSVAVGKSISKSIAIFSSAAVSVLMNTLFASLNMAVSAITTVMTASARSTVAPPSAKTAVGTPSARTAIE